MKKLLTNVTRLLKRLLALFPSPLPVGASALKAFTDDILDSHNIPNNPSYHHAVATMIMHLGPTVHRKPKAYFARAVIKAMANQVAYARIQELKDEEKKSDEALETASKPVGQTTT